MSEKYWRACSDEKLETPTNGLANAEDGNNWFVHLYVSQKRECILVWKNSPKAREATHKKQPHWRSLGKLIQIFILL